MTDAKQSLKAKMIAMELKLDYGDIAAFYQEAQHCFEQVTSEQKRLEQARRIQQEIEAKEAARRAVDGQLLATLYDTKGERRKSQVAVYQRPDESIYYTIGNGKKIEGVPEISVHKGGTRRKDPYQDRGWRSGIRIESRYPDRYPHPAPGERRSFRT
jgi:hypothetical protein